MNQDRQNYVLFIALAALILFGWPLVQRRFFPLTNPPVTRIEGGKTQVLTSPGASPATQAPVAVHERSAVLAASPRVRIETPRLRGSINLKGARIDDLVLLDYKETIAKNSAPVRLLSPSGAPDTNFASFGWQGDGLNAPTADTVWQSSAPVLSPGHPITLDAANAGGAHFRIEIAVDDNYMFTVSQTVLNTGTAPVRVSPYGLISRVGVSKDPTSWQIRTGPLSVHDGAADYSTKFTALDTTPQHFSTPGGWLGFTDKYWLTALIPDAGRPFDGTFQAGAGQAGAGQVYQADFHTAATALPPGQSFNQKTRLFVGAKEVKTLRLYENQGVEKFDRAIDWGIFEIVEKPIFTYLDWLFRLVGNFGVAIILLTVTIRAVMFPIAQRQFASMAAMRAIQPKQKALQERYKEDKPQLQKETMALYKAEGVNPVAGCLPTLLQIPIFFALYKVLSLSIEMRHEPFVAWIKDLSAPDPLTPVNLFGVLPFDPPSFLHVGVLAILLGVLMWAQFKMNPPAGDASTQQVMQFMPWMMMFFFAPLAAGLQVYYVANSFLTLVQQRLLYARHPQLKTAVVK